MKFPSRHLAATAVAAAISLTLAGCGDDSASPSAPTPSPEVGGAYTVQWTLQVLRKSDGFQTQFRCFGQVTLVEGASSPSTTPLTGFAVVSSGCTPESYALTGSVDPLGVLEFTTNGPKPPQGPCPGGQAVRFTGSLRSANGSRFLSARGITNVTCPQFGEHEFTYLIDGRR